MIGSLDRLALHSREQFTSKAVEGPKTGLAHRMKAYKSTTHDGVVKDLRLTTTSHAFGADAFKLVA